MQILLVDDEADSRSYLAGFLKDLGHDIVEAKDGIMGWEAFSARDFNLVLSDIRMPGWTGIELLKTIRQNRPDSTTDIVLFTAYAQIQTAVEALRAGAYDYILKPVNIKELVALLERVQEHQRLVRDNLTLTRAFEESVSVATENTRLEIQELKEAYAKMAGMGDLVVESPVMQNLYREARILHNDPSISIIIEGETGTGKEMLARYIHYGDDPSTKPFIGINCAAIPATIFESELFGYEAGTFTGALPKGQRGKLDLAKGGTLFLDEITEMPTELQPKLLRVIEEREFYRVGGLKKCNFEARLIGASNLDLKGMTESGRFRRDLYYRLSTAHLLIPPLRDRREDILPMALSFLRRFSLEKGKTFHIIHPETENLLLHYDWPGNVRELRNALERAVLMNNGPILQPQHLQLGWTKKNTASTPGPETAGSSILGLDDQFSLPAGSFPLEPFIERVINQALEVNNGNITRTAKYLGVSRRSLDYRLNRSGTKGESKVK
ncbi:MAG: sigma-54-dependent transcriptional regulator [Ignavibacteriales bacterium]